MRKGLWSPEEDERLVRCITKYVNGSWSDIARKAGLDRCGKSCRRRWMNHLRPDLKRGKFSMDEINLIVQLQEALGNRWSDIASHLEGRTDNDVKNLWNTQIKKRLSQLKAQNLSSVPITFSTHDVHASGSTAINSTHAADIMSIDNPTNMGFMTSTAADGYVENGNNIVLRFGDANIDGYSCSASSCEGSDHQPTLNDQENSSWRLPTSLKILSSAFAASLPHADLKPPKPPDSNDFLWSSMQGSDHEMYAHLQSDANIPTAPGDLGHDTRSELMKPCSSSSNIMSMGVPFLQPSQLPLLPADGNRACMDHSLFDLQFQDSCRQACTTTITSLGSSSYVPLRADSCTLADDNEECCSLQQSCAIPISSQLNLYAVEAVHNQMAEKRVSSAIDNLLSATTVTINCNPAAPKITRTNNSNGELLQPHNSQCSSSNVIVAESVNEAIDKRGTAARVEEAVLPANASNYAKYVTDESVWGPDQMRGADLYELQSNYMNVRAGAANGAGGWDDTDECITMMPHFSFPDWCKHLLHMSNTDLL